MLCVATALAVTTTGGLMTPWLLLAMTFVLLAGDAVESPTWRPVLPELVRKEDLPAASAPNGIELNIARAVGHALAGAFDRRGGRGCTVAREHRLFARRHRRRRAMAAAVGGSNRARGNAAQLSARTFWIFPREFSSFRRQRRRRESDADPRHDSARLFVRRAVTGCPAFAARRTG